MYQAVSNAGKNLLPKAAGLSNYPSQIKIVRLSTITVPWSMQVQGKPTIGPLTEEVIEQLFKMRLDELGEQQAAATEQAEYTSTIQKVQKAARASYAAEAVRSEKEKERLREENEPCTYYAKWGTSKGGCKFGKKCRRSHVDAMVRQPSPAQA